MLTQSERDVEFAERKVFVCSAHQEMVIFLDKEEKKDFGTLMADAGVGTERGDVLGTNKLSSESKTVTEQTKERQEANDQEHNFGHVHYDV